MSKIILEDHSNESDNTPKEINEQNLKINLFQGRTEAELTNSKFPDWDIIPPNQFINPRIKLQ
ncbi:MAG: hypothetical protein EOO44_18390 [Flavobacterium sp.]|nr:MAG: hypothetical protein EOO44_18390 [Flavobacterium sp.]